MPRSTPWMLAVGAALVAGCSAPPPRHVPRLYERYKNDLATIAVYRFADLTAAAPVDPAKPGAGLRRLDRLSAAGTVARDAAVDLLNGEERTRHLNEWEERASTDVAPPFRFRKKPSDAPFALRAHAIDEEAPCDLSPDQVRELASWTRATQILVGEVRRVTIDVGGSEGTSIANQTLMAPPGEGVVACEVRFVLYDGASGQRLLDRTIPARATFRHGDLPNAWDKIAYGETCARRVLFNAAWGFVAEILPHYNVEVVDQDIALEQFIQDGRGYDDRANPYSHLHGR